MGVIPSSIPTTVDQLNPFSNGSARTEVAPPLLIRELTGQQRALELKGRSLPYRPVSFGRGVQRTHRTTYQGNPQSTQQVLGPEEGECTLRGMWKERFIGGTVSQRGFGRDVTAPSDMVEFVDSIRRSGQTIQVQWDTIIRVGVLVAFEATWHRSQDVEWEIEFQWQSQGETISRVPAPSLKKPGLLDKLNALTDEIALGPEFLLLDVNAILVSGISDIRRLVGRMFDAARQVAALGRLPKDVAASIKANVMSLRLQAMELDNQISEVPPSQIASVDTLIALVEVELFRRDVSARIMDLLAEAAKLEEQTAERENPPPMAVVTITQNTTLYDLSNRFYGTPDLANFLAEVNFLDSAIVAAGTVIVVPPKPQTVET